MTRCPKNIGHLLHAQVSRVANEDKTMDSPTFRLWMKDIVDE